ncbi:hypothetical protein HPB48_023105 [Haemaphysalis longicornis]|uniref:Transposable element P transposase-like RNase H domain-containing protein n=1 Tax=Haemaphysalis longicornis TaxID=44386 RepID=A0A9J6GMS9_HAELO|nr:hypothetical protein HPB48_023105 [Haemaphysalis longicornis]
MRIKEKLQYNKQQDCCVGQAGVPLAGGSSSGVVLANSLLCFIITGLSLSYKIPVGHFLTKGLTGNQLYELVIFVIKKK